MRSCGLLSLVGIAQRPDEVVADGAVGGRDDQQAVLVLEAVVGQRLYVQAGSVRGISTSPGTRPRLSRSAFGITNRPALSMVERIPLAYHFLGRHFGLRCETCLRRGWL